jgi:hypothetical protein
LGYILIIRLMANCTLELRITNNTIADHSLEGVVFLCPETNKYGKKAPSHRQGNVIKLSFFQEIDHSLCIFFRIASTVVINQAPYKGDMLRHCTKRLSLDIRIRLNDDLHNLLACLIIANPVNEVSVPIVFVVNLIKRVIINH